MHRSAPPSRARLHALLFVVAAVALPLRAQQSTLPKDAELRSGPGDSPLATVRARTPVVTGTARDGYTQVTVSGYINASLLAPGRAPFNWSVKAPRGGLMRASGSPTAAVIAELRDGTGLVQVSRDGDWVRVRRTAWVKSDALARGATAVAAAPAPAAPRKAEVAATRPSVRPPASAPRVAPASDSAPSYAAYADPATPGAAAPAGALSPVRATPLAALPGGAKVAELAPDAVVTPIVRSDGWVRVRVEGWVHESDLAPAASRSATSLAAAELRADPDGTRGKVVHWDVEFLALQTADPLRHDLSPDEPYLLARGPVGENAIVYLAVPPALLKDVRALQPLTAITVTARVRNGRSEPIGVPVLELQSMTRARKR